MANTVKIRKGLDIKIEGKAEEKITKVDPYKAVEVHPDYYHGIVPKMVVKGGEIVKAGSPLFFNKNYPEMNFVSPVSGTVREVERGERRKVLRIVIDTSSEVDFVRFDVKKPAELEAEEAKRLLLASGLWPLIKQRPFDMIAHPDRNPDAIFISAFDSAPLAPDYEFVMKERMDDFQLGVDILSKFTKGKVHLGLRSPESIFETVKGVETTVYAGPHPAGNVGVQINHTRPINKGDVVWTAAPQDVAIIGRFFAKGVVDFTKIIALTGPEVAHPQYVETIAGNAITDIIKGNLNEVAYPLRFISGNVLTGSQIAQNGYLSPYASQISVIDEGSETNEFFGWAKPRFDKFSASNLFFSKLFPNRKFKYDARLLGGRRAIIMAGEWERVFPMDILPEHLIKAMIAQNIDRMENLGAYEVAPEDFALCEFVDTSKLQLQAIVRESLDYLKSETD